MLPFLLRRAAWGAVVVAATALIAFGGIRALRPELFPGDGLVEGVLSDFARILRWDLGHARFLPDFRSLSRIVADGWVADVWFMSGTVLIGVGGGLAAGVWCANRRGSLPARALEAIAMVAFCTPVYVIGMSSRTR